MNNNNSLLFIYLARILYNLSIQYTLFSFFFSFHFWKQYFSGTRHSKLLNKQLQYTSSNLGINYRVGHFEMIIYTGY
jgi:hypothetical protein